MALDSMTIDMLDHPADATQASEAPATGTAVATVQQVALRELINVEQAVPALHTKYHNTVYPVATTKGMAEAKAARLAIRNERYKIKPLVDEMKHQLRTVSGLLDSEAKRVTDRLMAIEKPIHEQITAEETRKEAARAAAAEAAAKAKAERDRKAQEIIDTIRNRVTMAVGQKPEGIAELQSTLELIDLSEHDMGDRAGEALRAKSEAKAKLAEMHATAVAWVQKQAEELERNRINAILTDVDRFGRFALDAIGRGAGSIQIMLADVEAIEITEERFAEFVEDAVLARDRAVVQLRALHAAAIATAQADSVQVVAQQQEAQRVEIEAKQVEQAETAETQAQVADTQAETERAHAAQASDFAARRAEQINHAIRLIVEAPARYSADMHIDTLAQAIGEHEAMKLGVATYGGRIGAARAAMAATLQALRDMHAQAMTRHMAAAAPAAAPAPAAAEESPTVIALRGLLKLIDDTQGVVGYLDHKGITLWEDIPEVQAAESALALLSGDEADDDSAPF